MTGTQRSVLCCVVASLVVSTLARPAAAGPPPAPWIAADLGKPDAAGATDVDGAGVWTLQGSSSFLGTSADHLHLAYQPIRGDATITGRFLSLQNGHPEWSRVGLMVRAGPAPGAAGLFYAMTPSVGLVATTRAAADDVGHSLGRVGPVPRRQANLLVRLQRVGNDLAGFYSRDGRIWFQAGFPTQTLAALPEEALYGIAVTSQTAGALTTAKMDSVSVQAGAVSVYGLTSCGADMAVLLQWRPLKSATAYNIYRGPVGATRDQFVKLNTKPVAGASHSDTGGALVNGTALTYAVAPLFRGGDGTPVEGEWVAVAATPVALPGGFTGCSINEGARSGSATFNPATGELSLSGAGVQIFDRADQQYFVSQEVSGDTQITVSVLARPTGADRWARAGLTLRESLAPGARHMKLWLPMALGLILQSREATDAFPAPEVTVLKNEEVRFPLQLRITRRGNTLSAAFAVGADGTFQSAGPPITFDPPLGPTMFAGVAVSAAHPSTNARGRFSLPDIRKP
jgi:hypothetical protein